MKKGSKKKILMTKEELIDLYLVKKLSIVEIAKLNSVGKNTMYCHFQEEGIERNNHYESLVGHKIEKLSILRLFRNPKNRNVEYFYCQCDCGREREVRAHSVKFGYAKSCGICVLAKLKRCGNISGAAFNRILARAKKKNIDCNISIEEIWDLFNKQDSKCALSGVPIILDFHVAKTTASLDRIDSRLGYVTGNIQWVHKDINCMKNDFTEKEFFEWINILYAFNHNRELPPSPEI